HLRSPHQTLAPQGFDRPLDSRRLLISVELQQAVFFSRHKSKASARPLASGSLSTARASARLLLAQFVSRSKASARPAAERVTSLLVQRSNQETPRKQSIPRRTCTKILRGDESSVYDSSAVGGNAIRFACRSSVASEAKSRPTGSDRVVLEHSSDWEPSCRSSGGCSA